MTIKSIIDIENSRKDDEYFLIHLFKEGKWWSGYELSAFLCHYYKNQLKDKLKINKKHLKSENIDFIKIGLMQMSFDKYLPNNHEHMEIIDDNHIIIDAKNFIDLDINKDNYKTLIEDLKSKITVVDNKYKNDNNSSQNYLNNVTILTIFNDILNFNVNDKSNDEINNFILKLKNDINKTFLKMFY